MSILVTFICEHCGTTVRRPEHYGVLRYCSNQCAYDDKMVNEHQLRAMARRGYTRKEAASALNCSYPTVIRAIKRFDINDLFPRNGAASWIMLER